MIKHPQPWSLQPDLIAVGSMWVVDRDMRRICQCVDEDVARLVVQSGPMWKAVEGIINYPGPVTPKDIQSMKNARDILNKLGSINGELNA